MHKTLLTKYLYLQVFVALFLFESSGFCYIINAGPSLGILLDILLLPCVWRSCTFRSVGLAPSHALADHRWGCNWDELNYNHSSGPGQLQTSLPALSCPQHQDEISSIILVSLPLVEMSMEWGKFSFYALKVRFPTPEPSGPTLLCCPDELQESLS